MAIYLKDVTKSYNGQIVLENINLSIEKGNIVGLLGKNGSGKSTLMKCITGLTKVDSGEISFGRNSFREKNLSLIDKNIGYIIEYPAFYTNLSAKENLEIFSSLYGIKDKNKIDYVLKKVGLENVGNKSFKNFSLGMKQRLGIANALLSEPEILILDEPINGLDPIAILEVRDLLKRLCKNERKTILISSHILSEIELIADQICLLDNKKIIEQISLSELEKNKDSYILIDTDNYKSTIEIIQNKLKISLDYKQTDKGLKIFNKGIQSYYLNKILVENGIRVNQIYTERINLEEYFKKILGEKNG